MADKRLPAVARGRADGAGRARARVRARAASSTATSSPTTSSSPAAGTVKVLDFGIAKLFASTETMEPRATDACDGTAARPAPVPSSNNATRAGAIVGTLPYMSPEQWGTDDVDHRTDLWAVGIILFEMLAGQAPARSAHARAG